jgi:hypothetical protein
VDKKLEIKKAAYIGLVLTILLTLPVVWHFFTGIPGRGVDTYQAIARSLMVDQHLKNDGIIGLLRWQRDASFWGILAIIGYTQVIFGQMVGYNLWWLLSFFLAFLGMWFFVKDVTGSNWAALTAGFVFAFIPFHFTQAVATNIGTMHYEWLAWLGYFLHRFLKSVSWQSALGVAVSILFIIMTEHQLLAFTIIFLIFFFPYLLYLYPEDFKKWRFWSVMAVGIVVLLAAGAVQFRSIWQVAHSQNNYLKPPYEQVENYSADAIDFLLPARYQTFWGERFNSLRQDTASNSEGRQSFYLGYLVILLVILGLVKTIHNRKNDPQEMCWAIFWLAIMVIFVTLSLGPTLHYAGQTYLAQKMPYVLLYKYLPYWDYIRTTSRIFVIAVIAWAFLAGLGAKYLEEFIKSKNKSRLLNVLTGFFIIGIPLEYLSPPVPNLDLSHSRFYDQLASDKNNYFLLEIPGSTSYDFGSYSLYMQQIHQKNKIDGIDFARTEKDRWTFQRNTPIIESLLYSLPTGGNDNEDTAGSDIVLTDYTPFAKSLLNFYNIRYLTISKVNIGSKKFTDQEFQNTENYIEQKLSIPSSYEDNFLKAYAVPQEPRTGYYLALDTSQNDSWGDKEGTGKSKKRPAMDGARMKLVNLGPAPINLQVNFKAAIKYTRYLDILLDGNSIKKITFQDFKTDNFFMVDQLAPGEHTVEFKIQDENQKPLQDFSQDKGVKFSQFETFLK